LIHTRVVKIDPKAIAQGAINEAAALLEDGGLVVFPTETVYGIAVNLLNKKAMERLKELKNRPAEKNFSIHLSDKIDVRKYAIDILPRAFKVMSRFWPGPLTLILSAPGGKTVGLRMPKNDVALRLLGRVDFPVIAPSANLAGHPAPRDAESALTELDGRVDMILDGGPTEFGVESTVLDARRLPFVVLREGYLKKEAVLAVAASKTILFVCTGNSCRSVMAEYLLRKKISDLGRQDIDVISAGTFAFLGMGPTRETQKLVGETGLDAAGHRAQKVSSESVDQADIIFAMERRHKEELLRQFPAVADRVHLLGEYLKWDTYQDEIQDPIGKSEEFYKIIFLKIKDAVDKLGDTL
jgi:tRNA threonylcarbamoyl adenosine modification protein (Sua5/YciO/YrdC/YwlC family)